MTDEKTITQNLVAAMEEAHVLSAGTTRMEDFILTTRFRFKVVINNEIN